MAAFLYLLGCAIMAALTTAEIRTRNRVERLQTYLALLCALVFCGLFALLVSAAQLADGRFQPLAALAVLLLTGGGLLVLSRTARRFRTLHGSQTLRRPKT